MATVKASVALGDVPNTVKNCEILHEGAQIILPVINGKPMAYKEAIKWIQQKEKDEETLVNVYSVLDYNPLDGAYAVLRAISKIYGFAQSVPTPGFWGDSPPTMIKVKTGPKPDDYVQVPWGQIAVPGIEGNLNVNFQVCPVPQFVLVGQVKKKCMPDVDAIIKEAQHILLTDSIYKGKALRMSFQWLRDGDNYNPTVHVPEFFDLEGINPSDLVLSKEVKHKLDNGLFMPIVASDVLERIGVPLKRGILLAGPYGCGKTLVSAVTAALGTQNGWTFLYGKSSEDLEMLLRLSTQYGRCIVFIEDVDQTFKGERTEGMNHLLNVIDGVDTKGNEIITVFTTNHPELLNKASIRSGRVNSYVVIGPPDADATVELIKKYGRGLLEEGANLLPAGEYMASMNAIPAFIRETVELAKIAAVARQYHAGVPNDQIDVRGKVMLEDVLSAAQSMKDHADLLKSGETKKETKARILIDVPEGTPHTNRVLSHLGLNGG